MGRVQAVSHRAGARSAGLSRRSPGELSQHFPSLLASQRLQQHSHQSLDLRLKVSLASQSPHFRGPFKTARPPSSCRTINSPHRVASVTPAAAGAPAAPATPSPKSQPGLDGFFGVPAAAFSGGVRAPLKPRVPDCPRRINRATAAAPRDPGLAAARARVRPPARGSARAHRLARRSHSAG